MPSKEDLSEQLALMTKLAAATERMAQAVEKIEQGYTTQLNTMQQLATSLGQLNVQSAVTSIENLNKTLKQTETKMNDTGKASEANFKKLGKWLTTTGEQFKSKFPKSVAVGTAALTGFYQGIQNTIALTKGVGGFFSSMVSGLANITASIIAIPIKIFTGLIDMAAKSAGGSNELMKALEDLRKEFGAFYGPTNKAIIDTSKSMKGFSDTGLNTWRVFGNMAERLNYIRELVTDMGAEFGKLRQEFEDNGGAILAYQKGLGLTGETLKNVTARSVAMGTKTEKSLRDMTKYSYELGDAFGLDAKLISRDMGKALGDVAHFGGATVKQIAEASTYARKLGVELDKITGTLDAFDTYDTAAENAAKLSQAMGVQIDAFEMMQAQSPAEQLDMLRKSFSRAGVDASTFNRAQLKLVASTTGLDEATVQQALSMKNQGASLDQIKKKGAEAEKKTMTQTEAMQKLADAIERLTMSGGAMEGGFWAMFVKGIKNGIMGSREFAGLMLKIQYALRQVYMIGVQLGRALVEIVPGLKDIGKALNEVFNPGHITKLFNGIKNAVEKYFGKGDDPKHPTKGSLPALVANLKNVFMEFFNAERPGAKKLLDGFKKFFSFASHFVVEGIKLMAQSLADGMRSIAAMIAGKAPIPGLGPAGAAAAGGLGFLKEILMPIFEALKEAGKVMWPAIVELVKSIGQRLAKAFNDHKEQIAEIAKPALGGLAALLFGPAFTRALLGALTASLAKAAVGGITKGLGGLINKAVGAEEAAKKVTGGATAEGMAKVGAVNKATGDAVQKGKGWGIKDAVAMGAKLVAIATALAIGGIEMAIAFVAMKKILDAGGIKQVKDILPSMLILGEMVLAAIPMSIALRIASKIGNLGDVAIGGLVIAAAVGIAGVVGAGLAWLLGKVGTPAELEAAGNLMLKMALVFLAMVPLILAATAIGAIATGPQAIVLVATAAGMAVISAAVASMAGVAMGIVKELNTLQIDASFQRKVDAFLSIMKAIQAFADTLVKVIELMTPSFTELLSGTTEKFSDKVNAAKGLISEMVGKKGEGKGIIGIVETVMDAIKQMQFGADMASKAQVFATVLNAIAETMKAMTPPPGFFEAGSSFLVQLGGPKPFTDLATDVNYYMMKMRDGIMQMITGKGGVIEIIEKLKAIKFTDAEAKQAQVVGTLLQAITGVMSAMTPSADTLKGFTKSVEGAMLAIGPVKVGSTKVDKLDTEGMAKSLTVMSDQMQKLLPALTSGVLKSVMAQTKGMTPADLEGLKAAAEVIKTAIDAGKLIADTFKAGGQAPPIDEASVNAMTASLPVAFKAVGKIQDNVGKVDTGRLRSFGANMQELADTLKGDEKGKGGVVGALMALDAMVKASNELDTSLNGLNKDFDVKAKLTKLANAVGLGGKVNYQVNPSRNVTLNVNLLVQLDVAEVEKVMVLRKQSIIGQRIDFATVTNPQDKIAGVGLTDLTPANPPGPPSKSAT